MDCTTTKNHAGSASANNTPRLKAAIIQAITIQEKIKGTPPLLYYMSWVPYVLLLCADYIQKS